MPRTPSARPAVERMTAYTPGEQPPPGTPIVKLNTNENPYPPSPRVMQALAALEPERLRRYPPPMADAFREAAARAHGVTPDMVLAGNGSDDLLAIVLRAYVGAGDGLAYPWPTYSLYPVLAAVQEARAIEVPWEPGWALPTEALLRAGARAIFFANPNAPSGTLVPRAAVRALAERFDGLVLVDEAYADFAEEDCLALPRELPNVVVCRTLSKGYSLAGLRLGYAVAPAPIVRVLQKTKDSYNVDAPSIAAAIAALEDRAHAEKTWREVKRERARLTDELGRRGFAVEPSQANFLLARVPGGDAGAIYRALKDRGVLVRFFDQPDLRDKLRITVGTPQENDALLAALP